MNLTEVLDRVKQGETMKGIAESMGTHAKKIQRELRRAGYQYDQAIKEWRLMDDAEREAAAATETKPKPKQQTEPRERLTNDEIRQIRSLLSHSKPQTQKPTNDIHERIKGLEKAERSRKTVIIRDDITERLDTLIKREKVFKSDALELAILDFLERYE